MQKTVTVILTVAEAKGVWQAAGETLDHADAAEASFPNPVKRLAAGRGLDKLARAWIEAESEPIGSPR